MSIEKENYTDDRTARFTLQSIKNEAGEIIGSAAIFPDPLMLDRGEWRRIIESHISSANVTFSMISRDNKVIAIDPRRFAELKDDSPMDRFAKIRVLAFMARFSDAVAITKEDSQELKT